MKGIFFILSLLLCSINSLAQEENPKDSIKAKKEIKLDSVVCRIDTLLQETNLRLEKIDINTSSKQRFKLYQTENIYTFLRLNTQTGKVYQVQWSLDEEKEFSIGINYEDLTYGAGYEPGTFELYPTRNMYQFLLLNKITGEIWHIQWGMSDNKRWIRRVCY